MKEDIASQRLLESTNANNWFQTTHQTVWKFEDVSLLRPPSATRQSQCMRLTALRPCFTTGLPLSGAIVILQKISAAFSSWQATTELNIICHRLSTTSLLR